MERPEVARSGRFSYFVYRLGSGLVVVVPRSIALHAGAVAGRFAARYAPGKRAVVAANLRHVVPEAGPAELDRLVFESFASYGMYWPSQRR